LKFLRQSLPLFSSMGGCFMRREFKDDLVATAVLGLCTVVLLLPSRPSTGASETRLAAPGAPAAALPVPARVTDGVVPTPNENGAAPTAPKVRGGRSTSASAPARLRS